MDDCFCDRLRSPSDICDVGAEAGVIASLILKPELYFNHELLLPKHFTNESNKYMYAVLADLAKDGVEHIDSYIINTKLNSKAETKPLTENLLTIKAINEFIEIAPLIARSSGDEYRVVADTVLKAAFRRETYTKLQECQSLCFDKDEKEIEQKIYAVLDDVMQEYSIGESVPIFGDIALQLWEEIKERQKEGYSGIPFKFPTLNEYVTIEKGELVVFGGAAKSGKSMMLLNCAVDLLKQGKSVVYLDSELNDRMFALRMIAHCTGIEFSRVKAGTYTEEEARRIDRYNKWIQTQKFAHKYIPMFDIQNIFSTVKKLHHTMGVDVLIIDYFKSNGDGDAYSNYASLGRFVDCVKNQICGAMNIAGLAAAQTASDGNHLADSAKIARNASTIIMINDKTLDEIERDGAECGNRKLFVALNRNGAQMMQGEYIDLQFTGNLILYEEATQHAPVDPY